MCRGPRAAQRDTPSHLSTVALSPVSPAPAGCPRFCLGPLPPAPSGGPPPRAALPGLRHLGRELKHTGHRVLIRRQRASSTGLSIRFSRAGSASRTEQRPLRPAASQKRLPCARSAMNATARFTVAGTRRACFQMHPKSKTQLKCRCYCGAGRDNLSHSQQAACAS